jgi:glycosyltransferase involved in cell wall biosynthesis
MIVKNEEEVLARCLDSIKDAADEIIIVDTGSTDGTAEIASRYTSGIYGFAWEDDFSAARNYAFGKAVMDYQMWLDADDVVPPEALEKIKELKETLPPDTDIVTMKYIARFDESGNPLLSFSRERLLRRERHYIWQDPIHECIPLIGKVVNTDIEIWHRKPQSAGASGKDRNINIYKALRSSGKQFSPRQQYYFARELKDHGEWDAAIYYFERFLENGDGWVEDNIAACFNLALCYRAVSDKKKILPVLFKSFLYAPPRAEICSEIGYYYKLEHSFSPALEWFRIAAGLKKPDSTGFILPDYWGYIPNVEACVCCCELGDYEGAWRFNEAASLFKPNDGAVHTNRLYLKTVLTPS